MSTLSVQTEILTLEKVLVGNYQFSIPSYQRPYVWSDDDVLLLFNDMREACKRYHESNKQTDHNYFIGTILSSVLQVNGDAIYELIDGQQRTTTLMLIAIAFNFAGVKSKLSELAVITTSDGKVTPRLQFAIRDQVQQLLGGLAGLNDYQIPSQEKIDSNEYLKQIGIALNVLTQEVEKLNKDPDVTIGQFAEYFYSNVQWVNNIVPAQMDLNHLFATMNTVGIQLEQADILKAKLFKKIRSQKAQYDAIWVACEHMDNYFERNVREVFSHSDWNAIEPEDLAVFDANRFLHSAELHKETDLGCKQSAGLSIEELAEQLNRKSAPDSLKPDVFETYDLDVETVYCEPIIKFPLFLIHTYRVYLAVNNKDDIDVRLHSDRLLEIFAPLIESDEQSIKDFIEMLWQVRYQFDHWVVKWVNRDDSTESHLGLTYQSRSQSSGNYYINRTPKELSGIVLLQSVRNFTGERSAQYWITPFIAELIKKSIGNKEESKALRLLERIDNRMSLAICSQKEASFKQARSKKPKRIEWTEQADYLTESNGTSFEHYWFQKLEYLLWKRLNGSEPTLSAVEAQKFKKYRITSKNSVEHVHPQNEEYKSTLPGEILNAFGNLVLLSPGENSSYSNQDVDKKQIDFDRKAHFDSLKLFEIFTQKGSKPWSKQEIESHQSQMLDVFATHYEE
ncbi:DUF262 domain-containing HNH endonuclease family protein [Vibrio splendidus]|uniref:DUF262 domain-containing protein n=1 Tax=Vibrio splendidus TaxID=29497 RepID=UPI003D136F0B